MSKPLNFLKILIDLQLIVMIVINLAAFAVLVAA